LVFSLSVLKPTTSPSFKSFLWLSRPLSRVFGAVSRPLALRSPPGRFLAIFRSFRCLPVGLPAPNNSLLKARILMLVVALRLLPRRWTPLLRQLLDLLPPFALRQPHLELRLCPPPFPRCRLLLRLRRQLCLPLRLVPLWSPLGRCVSGSFRLVRESPPRLPLSLPLRPSGGRMRASSFFFAVPAPAEDASVPAASSSAPGQASLAPGEVARVLPSTSRASDSSRSVHAVVCHASGEDAHGSSATVPASWVISPCWCCRLVRRIAVHRVLGVRFVGFGYVCRGEQDAREQYDLPLPCSAAMGASCCTRCGGDPSPCAFDGSELPVKSDLRPC
jgi:hypothetical protein